MMFNTNETAAPLQTYVNKRFEHAMKGLPRSSLFPLRVSYKISNKLSHIDKLIEAHNRIIRSMALAGAGSSSYTSELRLKVHDLELEKHRNLSRNLQSDGQFFYRKRAR